jgi:two-component system, OmpR family, alkaline phosphatase synthesis response regulator PhoP
VKTILVVEDEKDLRDLVCHHLEKEGFKPVGVHDAETAYTTIEQRIPDAIILDLMLPGMQGLELCKILRNKDRTAQVPILILTAKEEEIDKLLGFELGADDYITKPFSPRELIARLKAVLRRSIERPPSGQPQIFENDVLYVNLATHEIRVRGKEVTLSPTEFRLLRHLVTHPKIVFSRDQLLDAAWGTETFVLPRTVDVHIQRLRSLIEEDPGNPEIIVTVRGAGYKFQPDPP